MEIYFLYDPENGITLFRDKEERDKEAAELVAMYDDGNEWDNTVLEIQVGIITHQVVEEKRGDRYNYSLQPIQEGE